MSRVCMTLQSFDHCACLFSSSTTGGGDCKSFVNAFPAFDAFMDHCLKAQISK
jgi:hypothetical protein